MKKEYQPVISNRQALRDFTVEKTYEAGIELFGNEVKSLRGGSANLKGSFATVEKGQVYLYNMHISPYAFSRTDYEPLRKRKLLLHKTEIKHLEEKVHQKGYTVVPLKVYFKGSYAKVELAVARGKKFHDKRESIKEKEMRREIEKETRRRR